MLTCCLKNDCGSEKKNLEEQLVDGSILGGIAHAWMTAHGADGLFVKWFGGAANQAPRLATATEILRVCHTRLTLE